jgi:molybdate transport system substrate-binding protein
MRTFFSALLVLVSTTLGPAWAEDVSVAVAANFSAPAQKMATAFTAATGHKVSLVVGSTGKLYAQIKNGAPFHILLSADDETPTRLVKEGSGVEGSQFTYAVGRLALWSKQVGVVDAKGEVLRGAVERLAIADPKLAPYGAAAVEVLDKLGLRSTLQSRLVQGESIGQTFQFVSTGNATLGFVALSQIMQDGRLTEGSAWVVPAELHAPLKQDAVLLQNAKGHVAAKAFLAYLQSEPAKAVMRGYGYAF